jgi:protease I
MIPGGVMNPDKMRANKDCVNFAKEFMLSGKTVGAICHGQQLLIETGMLDGRHMTSHPSIKTDLVNAGVSWWENKDVITDDGLITSRNRGNLDAFNKKLLQEITDGVHEHA